VLDALDVEYKFVRSLVDLQDLTHLIIPGGESTTMEKLLRQFDMWDSIQASITNGQLQIFGTCAGVILCVKLGARVSVARNGYGAQQDSFTTDITSPKFHNLKGVFIRAPRIENVEEGGIVLASFQKEPVLVEDGNFLLCTFHPELMGERRIHEYFLKIEPGLQPGLLKR
jgi:5'-phosphate synthase pdxT subunit